MSPATKGPTKSLQWRDWSLGINRTAARTAIKDNQLFTSENFQPVGSGQLKSLEPPGDPIATIAPGIASLWGISIKIAGTDVGRLISINLDGSIDAIDPTNGNVVSVAPAATVTPAARLTMWQDTPLLIGDPSTGYFSWDGTTLIHYPLTTLTGDIGIGSPIITNIAPNTTGLTGGTPGMGVSGPGIPPGATIVSVDSPTQITLDANATATTVGIALTFGAGAPTSVSDLAVFEGRVWLVSASRTITYSAPNSYTDFSSINAAGSTTITDSVFQGKIIRLLSALEVLWIVGESAINAISNVQVVGVPAITTFSNTNIVANVGSVRPESVSSFFRTFLFFAPYGIYAIVGATPQKLSDDLDGLFPLIHTTPGHHNPSAVFALNEVFIWAVLVHIQDELGHRPVLLCFAKNAWFTATQGALDWITSLVDDQGNPQLWASDGHNIYQCFVGTGPHSHRMQTKLFDFGQFFSVKQALRVACEFESDNPVQSLLSIDTGLNASVATLDISGGNVFNWTGFGAAPFLWTGFGGVPFTWISGGLQLPRTGDVNASGYYLGMQLAGTSLPFTLSGLALEVDQLGEWSEVTP